MDGMAIYETDRTLTIRLPIGYTAKTLVHQKPGSHGTYDPFDLREQVVLVLKPAEGY